MSAQVRRFDWDEARRLRADGWTYRRIGEQLGVSANAVTRVCDPRQAQRVADTSRRWQQSGVCVDCGAQKSHNATNERLGLSKGRCVACAAKERATSVREHELRCRTCHEWKPGDAFPLSRSESPHRRGRHSTCRPCNTDIKRAYRERTRQPCSHGCGRLVTTADRKDKTKPLECHPCAMKRIRTGTP